MARKIGFLLAGLFFVVFASLIFGNHYYRKSIISLEEYSSGSYSSGSYTGQSSTEYYSYSADGSSIDTQTYTSTSSYDPNTGTTTYTYTDPSTGQTYTTTSTTASSYDSSTGTTTYTNTYTDPNTGETTTQTYTTYTDPSTGETTYTYTDPNTGQVYTNTYSSSTDSSGTIIYTYSYTDPSTGETTTSTYTSYTDPKTGETTYTYTDPVTGETHTSTSTYNAQSGSYSTETSSGKTYEITPADYGATYDSSRGLYTGTTADGASWTYNPLTGEYTVVSNGELEIGVHSGPGNLESGEIVISDEGAAYTFDKNTWVEDRYAEIVKYKESMGITLTEEEKTQIRDELKNYATEHAAGEKAYAEALANDLPVDKLEGKITSDTIVTDYLQNLEKELGRALTEEEKLLAYSRYEEWKEEQIGDVGKDYFEETHEEMKEYYDSAGIQLKYQYFANEEDYTKMLGWRKEYQEKIAQGEGRVELEREFARKFDEQFREPNNIAPPEIVHPDNLRERITEEFSGRLETIERQGVSLGDDHPLAISLRTQMQTSFNNLVDKQESETIAFIESECQGKIGASEEACEEQVETANNIRGSCGKLDGDTQTACYDVVQQVIELDCSGLSNADGCIATYSEIENNLDKIADPASRAPFLHQVEFIREQQIAIGLYEELKECQASGNTGCNEKIQKSLDELLKYDQELFGAQAAPLTPEEIHERIMEFEENRHAFNNLVDPAMKEADVPDSLLDRFNTKEDNRAMLMMEFTDLKSKELMNKGMAESDALKEMMEGVYYNCLYEQLIDAAQDSASHGNYRDMVANMQTANLISDRFIDWAKEEVDK